MPTYEYECQACQFGFEIVHSMKEEALTVCPECMKPELIRLVSGGMGVIVKGPSDHINIPATSAEQWKKDQHAKEMIALAQEPMTQAEEVAAYEQGQEREADLGFKQGHATGGRKPIISAQERPTLTKAEIDKRMSAARSEGQKRIVESQEARKNVTDGR